MVLDQISKEDPLFVICEVKTKDQEELKRAYDNDNDNDFICYKNSHIHGG